MIKRGVHLLLLTMLTVGCASMPPAFHGIFVDKEKPFVIVQTDAKETWGKLNHPFLRRINDDRIAMTYWVAGDGGKLGAASVSWPIYSDDGFKSFSFGDPITWADEKPDRIQLTITKGERMEVSFDKGLFFGQAMLPDGRYYMHQRKFNPSEGYQGLAIRQREKNGPYEVLTNRFNWLDYDTGEVMVAPDDRPDRFAAESLAVIGEDDQCIYTVAYGVRGRGYNTEKSKVYLFKSCDDGENYYYVSTVATTEDAPWGRIGPCEPAILNLGKNQLLVVMRTDGGGSSDRSGLTSTEAMLSAISKDGGKTWTHRRMPIPGVMPKLLRLSNGLIVVAHGRPRNNLSFSKDNGQTWTGMQGITPNGWATTGYMDMIEVSENRLFLVFDQINMPVTGGLVSNLIMGPTGYVNAIHGMFVNIKYGGE